MTVLPERSTAAMALLNSVRDLAPSIAKRNDEIEQMRRLPDDIVEELRAARLPQTWLPRAYGGDQVDPVTGHEVIETLAYADASVGWCMCRTVFSGGATRVLAPAGAAEIFADPSTFIARVMHPPGRADLVEGGYRVSGRAGFASGCLHSQWLVLVSRVYKEGEPVTLEGGAPALVIPYVPQSAFTIYDTWRATGLLGTGSHDIELHDVFVPEHLTLPPGPAVLQAPGLGPEWEAGPLYLVVDAPFALGVARRALDGFIELAGRTTRFTATQPLCEQPSAQEAVARAEALIQGARRYFYGALSDLYAVALEGRPDAVIERMHLRLATAQAMRASVEAVDLLHYAAGTAAIHRGNPIERAFRDLHTAEMDHLVGLPVLRTAGRVLMGLPSNNPSF